MTQTCEDGCCGDNCGCGSGHGDFYEAMERKLLQMTFYAHKEVLFDKIKQKIETEEGQKLDKIADLLVEASHNKWKSKQEAEKKHRELKEKLKDTFEE